jgi:anti-sigma regulatory factor (Ser/Thr protein kinase)
VFVPVVDLSQSGEARRAIIALASELRLDETVSGRAALIATEMATNVARHGHGGHLLVRGLYRGTGIEVIAVDRGPGMADTARALRDGFSTGGTSGNGLGAIRRIADLFDVYSEPGKGTVVLARVSSSVASDPLDASLDIGAVSVPLAGESVNGDGWAAAEALEGQMVLLVDGLGHGHAAHEAAEAAVRVLRDNPRRTASEIVQLAHASLRSTRGAALAVAFLDAKSGRVRLAGVGNVSVAVVDQTGSRSLASMNGIVGHEIRRVQEFDAPWSDRSVLVMHSDGIGTRWRLDQYPRLLSHHPSIIAAVLHRDFARARDDATVLAVRRASPRGANR